MGDLILHIGTFKTGTTSIQFFLNNNKERLENCNIYYDTFLSDDLPVLGDHTFLAFAVGDEDPRARSFIEQMAQKAGSRRLLISSEFFYGYHRWKSLHYRPMPKDIALSEERMVYRLRDYCSIFDKIRVVLYIRRQDIFIESLYNQGLKCPRSEEESLQYSFDRALPTLIKLANYKWYIDLWSSAFGDDNITVNEFDTAIIGDGLIHNFMRDIGADIDSEMLKVIQDTPIVNTVSFNRKALGLAYFINRLPISLDYRYRWCSKLAGLKIAQSKDLWDRTLLSPSRRNELFDIFADSNRSIAMKYLHKQDGTIFTEDEMVRHSPLSPADE